MLSFDWYGSGESFIRDVNKALDFTTALAKEKHKLFALSECGPASAELQKTLAQYESVYLLTWRHAPSRGGHPAMGMLMKAHEDLLKTMSKNSRYLFLKDIQSIQ